jgi:hypothetical protein
VTAETKRFDGWKMTPAFLPVRLAGLFEWLALLQLVLVCLIDLVGRGWGRKQACRSLDSRV